MMGARNLGVGVLCATVLLASGGCAGKSPPAEFYTLNAITRAEVRVPADPGQEGIAIAVGPAAFPEFLDRPQIVTRTGPHKLEVDEVHRWGGSLQGDFIRVLGENLSILLGTSRLVLYPAEERFPVTYRLVLDVQQFEGSRDGDVMLNVRWTLLGPRGGDALLVRQSLIRASVASTDYDALVSAKSRALATLSREIAGAIERLHRD